MSRPPLKIALAPLGGKFSVHPFSLADEGRSRPESSCLLRWGRAHGAPTFPRRAVTLSPLPPPACDYTGGVSRGGGGHQNKYVPPSHKPCLLGVPVGPTSGIGASTNVVAPLAGGLVPSEPAQKLSAELKGVSAGAPDFTKRTALRRARTPTCSKAYL